MEQSQWSVPFGGYLEGQQAGVLEPSASQPGQPYHTGYAAGQEYDYDLLEPSSHAQQAEGAHIDVQKIEHYVNPNDKAPRAFSGVTATTRLALQSESWPPQTLPLSNIATIDPAAQSFYRHHDAQQSSQHRQHAIQRPRSASASESVYGSYNARPVDFQQQPHTLSHRGLPTQHQPNTAVYTRAAPPETDRAPAKPLRTNLRPRMHVPPCLSCGKVLRNLSDAQ